MSDALPPELSEAPIEDEAPLGPNSESAPSVESSAETPAPEPEKPKPRPFAPLHLHSHYSLLEGVTKIKELPKVADKFNFPAIALTDNGAMYGAVEFYNAVKSYNKEHGTDIKPIIGADMYVINGDITERTRSPLNHMTLLVQNEVGYQNLCVLLSKAHLEGFYYKPRCNWDMLREHGEGLIALTSGLSGPLARSIIRANMEEARETATMLKDIFGENLYIELQDHGKDAEYKYTVEALKIANELNIDYVITNDSRYTKPDDYQVHQILLCMQDGSTMEESERTEIYGPQYYIKNGDEMGQLFGYLDREVVNKGLDNTLKVADKINFELEQGKSILPDFPLPEGQNPDDALREQVLQKAPSRYDDINTEVTERIDYELGIIKSMGFPAYFLIVADFIDYAREQDIPVGPGRGSAAGSIVAYILGITDIDPLEHQLLFERFLNPERVSMPDIDIDFCIDRREKVIDYVNEKYGEDQVSQIITFGTLAARAALKAVARVMDIPFAESNKLAAMIPATPGTKLKDALAPKMPLQEAVQADPQVKQLVDLALKIEGTACNTGVHAAGVVISKDPLRTVVPVQNSKEGGRVATYPMGDLEKIGLLKMDFLGLRNLTIIDNTIQMVKETKGEKIDIRHLPLDDEAVYAMLTSGDTDGIFQLESSGMKSLVKNLKPSVFEDIGALVALYRPGPLNSGMVDQFVDRKHGREAVVYDHNALEPILKDTYGTIVYQEQIMQIAQELAGYSLGRADLLRRAMGKKKIEVMEKERDGFITGSTDNEIPETISNKLFDIMSEFAAYCFNKSHSAAYAMVAYQTAYLKAHYPVEYLSALLSSVRNDIDKTQFYILAARKMGIRILPPDVNTSGVQFTPSGNDIRFGLASIKGVGVGVVESIQAARDEKPFASIEDFLSRVDGKALNKKTLESLIMAGALSEFGISRKQLFENLEGLTGFAARARQQQETGQVSLFGNLGGGDDSADESPDIGFSGLSLSGDGNEYSDEEVQKSEKSLLGFYVSSHPLDNLIDTLPMMVTHSTLDLKSTSNDTDVTIGGLVSSLQKRMTRKNKPMWIGVLEDLTGSIEFVVFSNSIEAYEDVIEDGAKILIKGKFQIRGDSGDMTSVIVNEAKEIKDIALTELHFSIVPRYEDVAYLGKVLAQNRGYNPVMICMPDGTKIKTGAPFWIDDNKQPVVNRLHQHFGATVKVKCDGKTLEPKEEIEEGIHPDARPITSEQNEMAPV